MEARDECKGCLLYAKGECNENCLQFKRLKRAEYIEKHPNINRKELINYLHGLARFNETGFDLGYNEAISTIIDHIEVPEESEEKRDVILARPKCTFCEHAALMVQQHPCNSCYFTDNRPNFKPNEKCLEQYEKIKEGINEPTS